MANGSDNENQFEDLGEVPSIGQVIEEEGLAAGFEDLGETEAPKLGIGDRMVLGFIRNEENRRIFLSERGVTPEEFDDQDANDFGVFGIGPADLADSLDLLVSTGFALAGEFTGGAAGAAATIPAAGAGALPGAIAGAGAAGGVYDQLRSRFVNFMTEADIDDTDLAFEVLVNTTVGLIPGGRLVAGVTKAAARATARRGLVEGGKRAVAEAARLAPKEGVKFAKQLPKEFRTKGLIIPMLKQVQKVGPKEKAKIVGNLSSIYGVHPRVIETLIDNPNQANRILNMVDAGSSTQVAREMRNSFRVLRNNVSEEFGEQFGKFERSLSDLELENIAIREVPLTGPEKVFGRHTPKFSSEASSFVTDFADEVGIGIEDFLKKGSKELAEEVQKNRLKALNPRDAQKVIGILKQKKIKFNDINELRQIRNRLYKNANKSDDFFETASILNRTYNEVINLPASAGNVQALQQFRKLNRSFRKPYETLSTIGQGLGPFARKAGELKDQSIRAAEAFKRMNASDIAGYTEREADIQAIINRFDPPNQLNKQLDTFGASLLLKDMTKGEFKKSILGGAFKGAFTKGLPLGSGLGMLGYAFGGPTSGAIMGVLGLLGGAGLGIREVVKAKGPDVGRKALNQLLNAGKVRKAEQLMEFLGRSSFSSSLTRKAALDEGLELIGERGLSELE